MRDQEIREALNQPWAASDSGDFATEHAIYQEDAVLDYPQSRERIVGRHNIQITRTFQPSKKRFVVHRIIGIGDLWVTPDLRQSTLLHREHNGVRRSKGCTRDAILR
jgi:hypothetical protein